MSGRKVMVQPINIIFNHLQKHNRVSVWLFDNNEFRIEAFIIGFDEFMNLVLDDAEEVYIEKSGKETKARQDLGRILLKGDNITVIEAVNA